MNILDGGFSHELMGGHNLYKLGEVEWTNESWTNFDPVFTLFADWTIDIDSPVNASSGFTDWFDFEIDTSNNGSSAPEDVAFAFTLNNLGLGLPIDLGDEVLPRRDRTDA